VSTAPAARSGMRFTERSSIDDAEDQPWKRWPEVVATIGVLVIAIWLLSSL
jgi:hypothetical protein